MGNFGIWVLFIFFFSQSSCLGFYLWGNYPHKHVVSDPLSVKVNSITSIDTKMPFSYYSLSAENRSELLMGDRIENSPYRFKMYTNETDIFFCKTDPLSKDNFELLNRRIDEMYQIHYIGLKRESTQVIYRLRSNLLNLKKFPFDHQLASMTVEQLSLFSLFLVV
ncbi:hypothetical protein KPL71_008444 [Citrus sinensis]|uniref:Uncharacterized protein n=1 Tax=Citrus sinensis TaxID=2711 RepID=A0ACB8M708_CITSI|nr:hypothetical protein KPL71_008444 [Citrus sinensis]